MINLTDQQLADFQSALGWKTGAALPDGRVLGVAGKRGAIANDLDQRVRLVAERLQPADKTVLEVGCCEGIHTVQLARVCRHVVALEVRPPNIACALTRLFVHDATNVRLVLGDARDVDERFGHFDIVFHVGVLYHLSDPVAHLRQIARLANDLFLDTHYADESLTYPRADIEDGGQCYRACAYAEGAWSDSFSGVEPTSRWLYRPDLLALLNEVGYDAVEVCDDRRERNGPRLTLLARRTATAPCTAEQSCVQTAEPPWAEAAGLRKELAALHAEIDGLRASRAVRLAELVKSPFRRLRPSA